MCADNGCKATTAFALKCVMNERPYTSLITLILVIATICGYAIRIFERVYYTTPPQILSSDDSYQDFENYWNALWMMVVTMTTVGYGDYYAVTHLGRITTVIASIVGIFLISLFMVSLQSSSSYDRSQAFAYQIIYRLYHRERAQKAAQDMIGASLQEWLYRRRIRKAPNGHKKRQLIHKMYLIKNKK